MLLFIVVVVAAVVVVDSITVVCFDFVVNIKIKICFVRFLTGDSRQQQPAIS